MEELNDIELRSEEFQEVLSRIPSWIERWGITLVFIVLAGLLIGSWFFKYPDIISAPIVVSTENLPADVVARTSGRIDYLSVSEQEKVHRNQIMGSLESTANTANVLLLDSLLMYKTELDSIPVFEPLKLYKFSLGEIQSFYGSFLKSYEDLNHFLQMDYHNKKITVVEKQRIVQQTILDQSVKQYYLNEKQLKTSQNIFMSDSALFSKKVISAMEFEVAKNTFYQSRQVYETAKSNIEQQRLGILQLDQQIFDLEQQRQEQFSQLELSFINSYEQLKVQIEQWKQSYLIQSPIDGIVTFTRYWQDNQNVMVGQIILTVVPDEQQRITGKIFLPPARAGKVEIGQTVNVKFDDFPYMEYGMVKVKITNIALVPITENDTRNYVLEVEFPNDLLTTYRKTLTFRQQMSGIAEVITDDLSLFERLLNPIRALLKK